MGSSRGFVVVVLLGRGGVVCGFSLPVLDSRSPSRKIEGLWSKQSANAHGIA